MRAVSTFLVIVGATFRLSAADIYFPKGSISDFEQEWYGKCLAAMKEPVLSATGRGSNYFAFRVLYLPTWGRPVAVRYETKANGFLQRSVMLSGDGGYYPGNISAVSEITISNQEGAKLIDSLEKTGFWTMPENDGVSGLDGSQLIVEAIKDGKHRVRVRWTPGLETEKRGLSDLVALYKSHFQSVGFWKSHEKNGEPDGAANGSQPISSKTNRAPSATGSTR
jgi:hypothetical protein